MIDLGLSASDRAAMQQAIVTSGAVRVEVNVLSLTGDHLMDISAYVADGQVDGAGVERQLSLTLDDPHQHLPFDTDDPADTALFLDRMIRASYKVKLNGDWLAIPVFTGPVTSLARNGAEVTVSASDKATLYQGAAWRPLTLHKGMKRTDALARIVNEANPVYAEPSHNVFLPDLSGRLPHHVALTTESVPWKHMQQLAHACGRQVAYNGRGELRGSLVTSTRSVFTFHGDKHITGPIQVTYTPGTVNAARVIGAVPRHSKAPVTGSYVAPADHPLSPQRIGRYLMPDGAVIRDSKIKTSAEADARAKRAVEDGIREAVDVTFDSIPVPFLDLGDLVHAETSDGSVTFRLRSFSLPLVVGDDVTMSVGQNRNVQLRALGRKHRPRPHHRKSRHHRKG